MAIVGQNRAKVAAGLACLGGILLFCTLAVVALLIAGSGSAPSGAPLFDAYLWRVARFTLLQAGLSTAISIALAIPVALALARQTRFPGRIWLTRLMALPLGLPALIAAMGLLSVWGRQGLVNSGLEQLGLDQPVSIYGLPGILLAHVFFNMPLAARLMLAGLERIPGEYWLVSGNLGFRSLSVFRFIEWPAIRRLIPGVASLVFMLCASSFTLVLTLGGGPAASTLEVAIYQALRFDFDPQRAVALSLIQMALTASLLMILWLLVPMSDEGRTHGRTLRRFDGRNLVARCFDGVILVIAALFVAMPLMAVVGAGLQADLARLLGEAQVRSAIVNSAIISVLSALVCVAAATAMIAARMALLAPRRGRWGSLALAAALSAGLSLVLLMPPVILGSGWFLLLRPLGDVGRFAPVVVVCINALMALPFAARVLEPALATHAARTARLADSLSMAGWNRLRWIGWPGLRRPMLMAFSFACALSLGDLGAVAIFGGDTLVTLPWLLYSRMGSYRTDDAAGLALLLAAACLLLTLIGTRAKRDHDGESRND